MKINELMIGDWVICKYYQDRPCYMQFGIVDFQKGGYVLCEPIPLTAEILEKNGFKVRCRYIWEQRDNYCYIKLNIAPKTEIEGEIFDESPILLQVDGATFSLNIIVEYVHELQHALRLCGIEKEIKL